VGVPYLATHEDLIATGVQGDPTACADAKTAGVVVSEGGCTHRHTLQSRRVRQARLTKRRTSKTAGVVIVL
jgi:hypothetical protein